MTEGLDQSRIEFATKQLRFFDGSLRKLFDQGDQSLGSRLGILQDDALLLEAEFRGMSRFAHFVLNPDEKIERVLDELGNRYYVENLRERLMEVY